METSLEIREIREILKILQIRKALASGWSRP
jgi:hypothetical protein